jgi:hypothetical protein
VPTNTATEADSFSSASCDIVVTIEGTKPIVAPISYFHRGGGYEFGKYDLYDAAPVWHLERGVV